MPPAIRKILLPTNFGPSSERTAAYAGALARRLGASVHLLHVLEEPLAAGGGAWTFPRTGRSAVSEQLYHERRAKLAALAAATLQRDTDRISMEVCSGTPADAIVDAAIAYGVDLIVMSAPAGRLPSMMMESVAERVLRAAPCPVLAVRQSGAARVYAGKRVA